MKKIICFLFGHIWRPLGGDFFKPYCIRCNKHVTLAELMKDAGS